MTKKFTEEQYQKIVEIGDNYRDDRMTQVNALISFTYDIPLNQIEVVNRAIAIANPLTREWAHDKFVEKEKKYYWTTKKKNKHGKPMVLFNGAGGIVQMMGPKQPLTESEIKEWGYNPEMFDREEV